MQKARRVRLIMYVVYVLVLIAGAAALYYFVPAEVVDAVRETYGGNAE
jgi:hypothetical protein